MESGTLLDSIFKGTLSQNIITNAVFYNDRGDIIRQGRNPPQNVSKTALEKLVCGLHLRGNSQEYVCYDKKINEFEMFDMALTNTAQTLAITLE
jgi:23S rRNA A1618 N6-methylase RlmF